MSAGAPCVRLCVHCGVFISITSIFHPCSLYLVKLFVHPISVCHVIYSELHCTIALVSPNFPHRHVFAQLSIYRYDSKIVPKQFGSVGSFVHLPSGPGIEPGTS